MTRWQPDSRSRLEHAAMELFEEQGFDGTTVAAIAERAGVTERTFFRHFTDKREVLFKGAHSLEALVTGMVDDAPAGAPPLAMVAAAFAEACSYFAGDRERVRRRQAVIASNDELLERELIKLAALATAVTEALERRGVPGPAARLTAEAGVTVFRVAIERWVTEDEEADLVKLLGRSLDDLRHVTAAGPG